jgi:hypothetical protein
VILGLYTGSNLSCDDDAVDESSDHNDIFMNADMTAIIPLLAKDIALSTGGYVAADLSTLVSELYKQVKLNPLTAAVILALLILLQHTFKSW